ncbi:PD40 domain-containing protein, partial [candidate division KSB1 bacterium]|nr:PD40 domain-containing protein [candidate division KSB1 bacterium]
MILTKGGFMKRFAAVLFVAFAFLTCAQWGFASQAHLLRFPDVHEDAVVFVAGGDIWIASTDGGLATRLTLHDGDETFPKFSPDGTLIAFTGEYDGNGDIYVMDRFGGNITRVTYHPDYDEVVGWHEGKNKIIFRSGRYSATRSSNLYLINHDGSGLEDIPLPQAVQGCFSPDGGKIAFNKVSRENRTWKRYQGGTAQEVYVYDLAAKTERNVTRFRGTDRIPMWIGDKIYFSSDRDGVLNIWSYDTNTEAVEQVTTHKAYDVRRPSMGGEQIVYEHGGDLYLLNVNTKQSKLVPIEIRSDAPEVRPYLKSVEENVTGFACSPDGATALLVARGEIFTVPRKEGITHNLSKNCGARDKDAVWSPDGKTIAYFSDQDGEYNLYVIDAEGETTPQKLTDLKDGYRHTLRWSPDSKKLGYTDQTLTLYYIDVATKKITRVDKAEYENVDISLDLKDIYDYTWAPDSRYIAYAKMDESWVNKIYIFSLETGKSRCISDGAFNDFHPVFTPDGEHLLFVSNRRFSPTFCDFEWEMVYKKNAGIYSYTLKKDGESLMPLIPAKKEPNARDEKSEKDKPVLVTIDFDGLNQRIEALPVERGNYRYLSTDDKH